jgi:DNA ligase-1
MFQEMFPTLYSIDKFKKIRQWTIKVVDKGNHSQIITYFGVKDGKMIETIQEVLQGKNLGKKNETTPYQQAIAEAQSKWMKKKDKELYTEQISLPETSSHTMISSKISPMLAQDYKKHASKVKYPCYIQPKLDGYRCIYSKGALLSRQHKEYTIVKTHHQELVNELGKLPQEFIYDGELYIHDDKDVTFETLGVLRKQKNMTTEDLTNLRKISYYIYDIVDNIMSFEDRYKLLNQIDFSQFKYIHLVNTIEVNDVQTLRKYHVSFVNDQNYEGTMVRNKHGKYIGYRSTDLLKYKNFEDHEFKIVDYTYELNNNDKLIIWKILINETKNIICDVRPQGSKEERIYLYNNGKQFIGKKLWTKFFGYTDKGSLRFPSTQRNTYKSYIRDIIM